MSHVAPPPSFGHYPPQWQPHQWQAYGPPPQHHPDTQQPHHYSSAQPPSSSYYPQQAQYATPSTEGPGQAPPIHDSTQADERWERRRSRGVSPPALSTTNWPNLGTDWLFLRQHILDMGEVLMLNLCDTTLGPRNKGRYHVVLLLKKKSPECWQAGFTCDGRMVIEAPERACKQDAMMTLSEVIATRLGKCMLREWEFEDAETGVEEGADGAKFAVNR
ncbi:hypothetical protein LTR08_006472 [Meristemomyces frigidus]|nr:hypothetical protein LTR08_006472 [Meristemomyces frigidus]